MSLDEFVNIIIELINNALILLSVIFLYTATNYDTNTKSYRKKFLVGLFLGLSAIYIMTNPWKLSEGVFFDTRSILYAISGVFFGWIPTLVSATIGSAYRIYVGGTGVYAGVLTILFSSGVGLLCRHSNCKTAFKNASFTYYIVGVFAHVLTLLCFFIIPNPMPVIQATFIPYLIIFPFVTMIIGIVIDNQKNRLSLTDQIIKQRTLLKASLDSTTTMEMYALDQNLCYLNFNDFHKQQMKRFYQVDIKEGDEYLNHIQDPKMRLRLQRNILKTLSGEVVLDSSEVEDSPGKFLEERFSPIYYQETIVGCMVFSSEITDRKKYEASILYLSYNDALTGLHNRRYYQEQLPIIDNDSNRPITVILCDINGLKIMNDAFGHDAGDELLKEVSFALKQTFSDKGFVCRTGGDEFTAVLNHTSYEEAAYKVDKLRTQLEKKNIKGMIISVSFGISTKKSDEPITEVIRMAEDQMYKNKLFEISSHRSESIKTILNTLHEKNPREDKHSKRVSELCILMGKKLGFKSDELNQLKAISNLHDIGKIAIDEAILNKPGKLTEEEWKVIKRHPEIGYRIISTSPEYAEIAYDILSHHEKYDGTGYPRGIKGENIPIRARIISIADAFDAMISKRPYRNPLTIEEARTEILRCSGTQFDPKLVKLFIDILDKKQFKIE
ncbi:MAG: diguanylate cyclase [Acholeplasma sp.]|nr:diguanylate cyclase [Acholeplasma sp.]